MNDYMPYKVLISSIDDDRDYEIEDWLYENIGFGYKQKNPYYTGWHQYADWSTGYVYKRSKRYFFKHEIDCMAFKLAWEEY